MVLINNADPKLHTQAYTISSTTADASATLLYTVPNNYNSIMRFLSISNGSSSTANISVQFFHKLNNTYHHIIKSTAVDGNSIIHLVNGGYFFLHGGDKLLAYADTADVFEIMISSEEYFVSSRFND